MKARKVYEAVLALKLLLDIQLPIKASYAISRLLKKLEPEFTVLDQTRISLIKLYGTPLGDGSVTIHATDEKAMQKFLSEFNSLLDSTEISEEFPKLNIEHFGSVEIKPAMLLALDAFIE